VHLNYVNGFQKITNSPVNKSRVIATRQVSLKRRRVADTGCGNDCNLHGRSTGTCEKSLLRKTRSDCSTHHRERGQLVWGW